MNRNLGAGDSWGRAVETAITALETSVRLLEQRVQSSLNNISANVKNVRNQIDALDRRAEVSVSTQTVDGFDVASGTNTLLTLSVPVPAGKTKLSIYSALNGRGIIEDTGAMPVVRIVTDGSPSQGTITFFLGNNCTLTASSVRTVDVANRTYADVVVELQVTNAGMSYPEYNKITLSNLVMFS